MNDAEKQFERIVAGLNIDDTADSRHKAALREQMLTAYAQSASCKSPRNVWQTWSKIMKSNLTKTAAAAAIILLGILLTWMAFADKKNEPQIVGPTPEPQQQIAPNEETINKNIQLTQQAQLKLSEQLFEAQNVPALAALFEAGTAETKLAVANYLADLGTGEAFEALKRLDTSETEPKVRQAVRQSIKTIEKQQEDLSANTDNLPIEPQPKPEVTEEKSTDDSEMAADVTIKTPAKPEEGISIMIKVVEKETDKPIADADIRTYDRGSNYFKTDPNGICVVRAGLNGGTCINLFAAKEGFVGQSFTCGEGRFVDYFPKEAVFKLEKGTVIGGVVHDPDGNPLAGATVSFDTHSGLNDNKPGMDVRFRQEADEKGRWRCDIAPENLVGCSVGAGYPGYASSGVSITGKNTVNQLRTETHILTLSKGYSISGTVKDEAGNLIKGARVQLGDWYYNKDRQHRTHTDTNGVYVFKNMQISQHEYLYENIEGQGKVPVQYPMEYVTVSAAGFTPQMQRVYFKENQMDLEVILTAGAPISGRVVDFEGKPVAGATVRADEVVGQLLGELHLRPYDWNTKTDADGRFVWQHAPDDKIHLKISKTGYLELETPEVSPAETEYEFVMNPRVRVIGQVINVVTKEPIAEFIFRRHEGGTISSPKKIEHNKGRFETAFAEQGETFTISFQADGYKPTSSRKITLIEQDVELLIEMQPDAGIDGVVIDADGKPLKDARVMIPSNWINITNAKVESNLRSIPNTLTDTEGRFHLDPVANIEYNILILADAGYLFMSSKDFPEDGRFVLQPYAKIVGTYYKGTRPVADTRIRIDYPHYHQIQKGNGVWEFGPAFNYSVQTDEQGRFVFDKLIGGTARILIDPYKYVELKAGETQEVHLGGNGLMVSGHCLSPDGEALNEDFGDCSIGLQRIYDTLPFPESEWPLPDTADAMSYTELVGWFTEFGGSDAGEQWFQEIQDKYGELNGNYSGDVDQAGRFEMADVKPGTYLLSLTVYPWQDPDQFPRRRDYNKGKMAVGAAIVTVPEFETAEQMDTPVDVGTLQSCKAPLAVGDIAPDFDIAKLTGPGRIRLGDYRGRTVLVNFTNPTLKDVEPDKAAILEQVCQKASGKAAIVNVAMELLPWEYMRNKMRPLCILPGLYGIAQMHHSKIYVDYELGQIPQSILIGADGRILWKGEPDEELLETLLE